MSVCGDAQSDRNTATGNITATGAPVRRATHVTTAREARTHTPVRAAAAAGAPGSSRDQKTRGVCLFHAASPPYPMFARSDSKNARLASGIVSQLTAARTPPVTVTPSQL